MVVAKTRKSNRQKKVRQSAVRWLPFTRSKRRAGRRAHKFIITLGSRRLTVTARRFRTNPARRAANQKVLSFREFTIKEVAINVTRRRSAKKTASTRLRYAVYSLLLLGSFGSVYFGYRLAVPAAAQPAVVTQQATTKKPATATTAPQPMYASASVPTRISIPKIGVDAPVQVTAQKTDGTLAVPSDTHTAGWYKNSPTPGQQGPAIFAGHVDSVNGPAIFWDLGKLTPGDTVDVTRADGTVITFKIDAVKQYPQTGIPAKEVYGNIDYAGIRIITCSGTFNHQTRHYSHNTVVFGSVLNQPVVAR